MSGVDRRTWRAIDNLNSALQSVEVILTTRIGSRIMRREFGGGAAELLGRAITPQLMLAFAQVVGLAIDLWEPRFSVRRIHFAGSADELRMGRASLGVEVDWRPRGHLGDLRVERVLSFSLNIAAGKAQLI